MYISSELLRKSLFVAGLIAIALSVLLTPQFARDPVAISEPSTLPLLALGGVAAIAIALVKRRKK